MKFGSVCSGIEAATVAWHGLGWRASWLAEIDKFASAVLAHHYPTVPNLGDMTQIARAILTGEVCAPEVLCGGTPCQAFSVAGLRESLADARGNLTLKFVEIANAIDHVRTGRGEDECIVFWENVPGVLSTKDNAFGCFLAGLAGEDEPLQPPGQKWANAGAVYGPRRAVAWRTLDAQYFGVAQRRRRVFVVASARKGFDPAQVLFEWDGVRRDTAPSREARQTAPTIPSRSTAGGGLGTDFDCDSGLIQAFGGNRTSGSIEVAPALLAQPGSGWKGDFESETFIVPPTTHTLRGEGFDASEDGTGRGTPLVPVAGTLGANHGNIKAEHAWTGQLAPVAFDTTQITSATNRSNPLPGDPCHPLAAGAHAPAIAFPANLSGTQCASTENLSPALGAKNPTAVAFAENTRHELRLEGGDGQRTGALSTGGGKAGQGSPMIATSQMQVRRLTPEECEALQGFHPVVTQLRIDVCIDHQSNSALVETQCRKWQSSAWPAAENASMQSVGTAGNSSNASPVHLAPLAALRVRMRSEAEILELRNHGRLIWSANSVARSSKSLPSTALASSVQEIVTLALTAASGTGLGKAESLPSIRLSLEAASGGWYARPSIEGTEANATDAVSGQSAARFTTLNLGQFAPTCDSTLATFCCFVMDAISGCIPSETLSDSFSFEIEVATPYTAIPWRGKPADLCPDGPRYKALGNSWAVPNVAWIGRRIQASLHKP